MYFLTQILIVGLVALRNISYVNCEFVLANIVIVSSNVQGRLDNHSLHLTLKIKLPYLMYFG